VYRHALIEVPELAERLHSEGTVVIDCRFSLADAGLGRGQYEAGHIPSAEFLDLEEDLSGVRGVHGGRHPMPSLETFTQRLRQAGISSTSLVVAYDDSRFGFAARFWWMLRHIGHDAVRVLNGGFAAWTAAGLPLSVTRNAPRQGNLPRLQASTALVDRAPVMACVTQPKSRIRLVDARERKRYRGEDEPIDPVAGHIPGALCYPWQDFTTTAGAAISEDANRLRWSALDPAAPVIVYCGSGVTACVDILSMHAAGFSDVSLYGGSWSDWCSYSDSPIALGGE
jgi:thiosulfate/3-mercaptopyruvate sulfurtransferase